MVELSTTLTRTTTTSTPPLPRVGKGAITRIFRLYAAAVIAVYVLIAIFSPATGDDYSDGGGAATTTGRLGSAYAPPDSGDADHREGGESESEGGSRRTPLLWFPFVPGDNTARGGGGGGVGALDTSDGNGKTTTTVANLAHPLRFFRPNREQDKSCVLSSGRKYDGTTCCAYRAQGATATGTAATGTGTVSPLGGPPRRSFGGRVLYYTMSSMNHAEAINQFFVGRLKELGVEEGDIGVICIDDACSRYFSERYRELRVDSYTDKRLAGTRCEGTGKMKCNIIMGKADILSERLREGNAVFFFDADVRLFRHPYRSMRVRNPNLDVYVQEDNNGALNNGVMLLYPSLLTLDLLRYSREELNRTLHFDHNFLDRYMRPKPLWGRPGMETFPDDVPPGERGVCGNGLDYELLPLQSYVNILNEGTFAVVVPTGDDRQDKDRDGDGDDGDREDGDNHILVHATCLEGEKTKEIAILTMFGMHSSLSRKYYLATKTVTLSEPVAEYRDRPELLDAALRALTYEARRTGRAIRLGGKTSGEYTDADNPYAVVSAEYVWGELGIPLVEPLFYERAKGWFSRDDPRTIDVPKSAMLSGGATGNFQVENFVRRGDGDDENEEYSTFDELVYDTNDLANLNGDYVGLLAGEGLGYIDGTWKRPFTCLHPKSVCMSVCDA